MSPFAELKLAKLDVMDADLNNYFNKMQSYDSSSIPEKLCYKLACSSSDMVHDASTGGISAYKHAYSRSGMVHNVSMSGLPTHKPQKSVEKQSKSIGNETSNEDLNMQNPRNIVGCVYESQKKPCLNVSPYLAPNDGGSKEALAGLIFMSNDKVRRSYFKYHVLGMPISRKHIVDRVKIGTKLFLFEFEARQLWGIYEATSETSLDIEKDAYQASSAPLPAQVKFRVLKKCRPLPERLFQWIIKENYFTSIKFNPELTAQQVSNLIQLYDLQAVGDRNLNRTSFAAENNTHSKNDALIDSTKMAYKLPFPAEHIGIPHMRRLMDRDEHDLLERASLNLENSHFSKTSDQIKQSGDIQRGAPLHTAGTPLFNPNTTHLSLEVKSTANNISNTQDEVLQAEDPKHRNGKAELVLYTGKPTLESKRQGMIDDVKISPVMNLMGGSNRHLDIKRDSVGPNDDGCLLYELKVRPPLVMQQPCKCCKEPDRNEQQYPCSHGDPYFIESCEHNTLLGNMKIIASPSVCVKCLTNDRHPASRRKNNEEQDNVLSYQHLCDSIPGKNSRQSLDIKNSPLLIEVVQWDAQPRARKETLGSILTPGDSEARAREALDSVLHKNNYHSTPMSVNARKLPWPDGGAWPQDHATRLVRNKASFHPSTSITPAWLDHQTGFLDVDHGDKSPVDNSTCITRQNKALENDGLLQDRKLDQVANGIVTRDHMTDDDDEAWLERARSIVLESLKARSNNIMGNACRRREEDAFMQLENQVQSPQLQVLGKRSRLAVSSDLSTNNDNVKRRGSVWSRLSFPRKTSNATQVVLPSAKLNEP